MKKIKDLSRLDIAELTRQLPKEKGTYLLFFEMKQAKTIRVGKLAETEFAPGFYAYVGSAFGPGGLHARLRHHLSISERCHWHLDYIRPAMHFLSLWITEDTEPREHDWASVLAALPGCEVPVKDLGATDCQCHGHFFHFDQLPTLCEFRKLLREKGILGASVDEVSRYALKAA